jgi:RNA recognition motif-containing protein
MPPVGCAHDAYKLFVGNIPKTCTEEELRPVFESVGPVVELVVVRDKFTHESKGSAFVWYTTKADADKVG